MSVRESRTWSQRAVRGAKFLTDLAHSSCSCGSLTRIRKSPVSVARLVSFWYAVWLLADACFPVSGAGDSPPSRWAHLPRWGFLLVLAENKLVARKDAGKVVALSAQPPGVNKWYYSQVVISLPRITPQSPCHYKPSDLDLSLGKPRPAQVGSSGGQITVPGILTFATGAPLNCNSCARPLYYRAKDWSIIAMTATTRHTSCSFKLIAVLGDSEVNSAKYRIRYFFSATLHWIV
ncbi:Uncharacterized protein HZ326_24950 [Fusarium oxysporum f. sp. albedinis]|nr:Uncharacterized protein HZ326_24950 [Fusarium oxysporum f. sp. albedinis]